MLACTSGDIFAQTSAKDRLKEIEEMAVNARKKKAAKHQKLFSCDAVSRFYFGFHQVSGQPELESKFFQSHEIGFNVIDFNLNPAQWVSLSCGLDLKWDSFLVNKDNPAFIMDGKYVFTTPTGVFGTGDADKVSELEQRIRCFALSVPVSLGFHAPWFSIRGGAGFDFNIDRHTSLKSSYKYKDKAAGVNQEVKLKEPDAKVRNLCINYFASIDFDGLGIYCKYYPKPIFRDSGVANTEKSDMKYWTLGLIFSF